MSGVETVVVWCECVGVCGVSEWCGVCGVGVWCGCVVGVWVCGDYAGGVWCGERGVCEGNVRVCGGMGVCVEMGV